ncbi:prepilin peptidase [Methanocella sp. MCL-LM]|uniref:prepilin peptidase n=1 Tax=Methanocella sp. MCL-LM TaxID=3412035 RepID=UPI003C7942E1
MALTDLALILAAGILLAAGALIDHRSGRIPNWLTLPAILSGAVIMSIRCLYGYPVWTAALTIAGSLSLTYLLWLAGCWGGGDAKVCLGIFLLASPGFPVLCFVAVFSGCLAVLLAGRHLYCRTISRRACRKDVRGRPLGLSLFAAYVLSAGACFGVYGGLA